MPKIRLIFPGILSILSLFISGGALATSQEEDQLELTKVRSIEELAPFKGIIDRIESYESDILSPGIRHRYDAPPYKIIEGPDIFGVYTLTKKGTGEVLGLQAITPHIKKDTLYASAMTDIIPAKQGQGFGKALRRKTASLFDQYIRTDFFVESEEQSAPRRLTLSHLYSDNEWMWGKNGASLKSALNAGYGIVCISPFNLMGLVQMTYPRTEYHWSNERVEWLMEFSRLNRSDLNQDSLSFLIKILEDLDYSQDTELSTFYAIITFIERNFEKDEKIMNFIDDGPKDKINQLLQKISSPQCTNDIPQHFDPALIQFIERCPQDHFSFLTLLVQSKNEEIREIASQLLRK